MMAKTQRSRLAGIIYFICVVCGIFSLMYVPEQLIDSSNIPQTITNIKENLVLYKLGYIAELICYIAFLILPIVLYQHFKDYNKLMANIMVGFVIAAVPISCLAVGHKIDIARWFLVDANFQGEKLNDLVYFSLKSYSSKIWVAQIFWGLWLFPFGYLGYTSKLIPRVLSAFLMLATLGYLIIFIGGTLIPNYNETFISKIADIPASIGEIGTCLWLLIRGIKKEQIA